MLKLMNSAMMPKPGNYVCREITAKEFQAEFHKHKNFESYIGYENACKVLSELCDKNILLSREQTDIRIGDIILVARLGYRVNPAEKATRKHGDSLDDYDFFRVTYHALEDAE